MKRKWILIGFLLSWTSAAAAEGLPTTRLLPFALANEAAIEAVAACQRCGFNVTATVLDASGVIRPS
jgi:hypothetical protein